MDFHLSDEQRDIVKAARDFARGEFPGRAREFDQEETFDQDLWRQACELGFVGVFLPEEYGGGGYGFFEHSLICEEFWRVDPGIGQAILSCTFGSEALLFFGSPKQKQRYLPPLVQGRAVIAAAITEADAGSDPSAAATMAELRGEEWVVNGSKMFITNGTLADYVLIFCLTDPDNPSRHRRHSMLIAETDRPGYEATKIRGKLGIRASDTAEVSFRNLRLPKENLVGRRGEGFRQLMSFFNWTRLHICAQGVGVAQGALDLTVRHVKNRRQFGQPLASFQAVQFTVAEMATRIEAARALYHKAAWLADQGQVEPKLIAAAKYLAGGTAVWVTGEAVQLHGGYGFIDEYDVQRFYRDAKIVEIYEGTREMEKLIVARNVLGPW